MKTLKTATLYLRLTFASGFISITLLNKVSISIFVFFFKSKTLQHLQIRSPFTGNPPNNHPNPPHLPPNGFGLIRPRGAMKTCIRLTVRWPLIRLVLTRAQTRALANRRPCAYPGELALTLSLLFECCSFLSLCSDVAHCGHQVGECADSENRGAIEEGCLSGMSKCPNSLAGLARPALAGIGRMPHS